MIVSFPRIGKRTYITNSTFINFVRGQFVDADSIDFYFHAISTNTDFEFLTGSSAFEKKVFAVTGKVGDTYFGFRTLNIDSVPNIEVVESSNIDRLELHNLPFVFSNHFRDNCLPYIDKLTHRLLMAKVQLSNIQSLPLVGDYEFTLTHSGSRFVGVFTHNGVEVARELILARNKE